jgi:UV DNA damage endonuclease
MYTMIEARYMRLGFSTKVYGCADMPAFDGRSIHAKPHLSVSLAYLGDILSYLSACDIHMYRMHSRLLPLNADAAWNAYWQQLDSCESQLALVGTLARDADIRLSFHPYSSVVLNAVNQDHIMRSRTLLRAQATILDMLGAGPEAVIVLHVGGVYDDWQRALDRFVQTYESIPAWIRQRLVLENDDHRFSHLATWRIYERCGIPLVFDNLHHLVFNPEGVSLKDAMIAALSTWPDGIQPKIHYVTPRSEMRRLGTGRLKTPTWREHSDYVNPFEFSQFIRETRNLGQFDIMLEVKARDMALLKLRQNLRQFAPDLCSLFY